MLYLNRKIIKGGRDSNFLESAYRLSASPAGAVRFAYPLRWPRNFSPLIRFDSIFKSVSTSFKRILTFLNGINVF